MLVLSGIKKFNSKNWRCFVITLLSIQVAGHVFVSYNVGREDIAIGEMNIRVDDGKYHVLRFTRSGANSTLQLDEMQVQTKHPIGKKTGN